MTEIATNRPKLYKTLPHDCSYLSGQIAETVFIDPKFNMSNALYSRFAQIGFRRSGDHVYIPDCPNCSSCLSLRVPVHDFNPSRSQRRLIKKNQHLEMQIMRASFIDEHYRLYLRYMRWRHPGGGMDVDDPEAYHRLFASSWADTWMYCFTDNSETIALAITDRLENGLSAVYTFYAPELVSHGLGTYAILRQIQQAKEEHIPFVYLGYWVNGCDKMAYKTNFRPYQLFRGTEWQSEPLII